jgi:putative nucleotidyltransferase with HDIG domain
VIRGLLSDIMKMEGYFVDTANDGVEAIEKLKKDEFNVIISDLMMPNMHGIELLERLEELKTDIVPIIMTGYGTIETAIQAMKKGAYDYILKPFKIDEVTTIVRRGLERQRLQRENLQLKQTINLYNVSEAINSSLTLAEMLDLIVKTTFTETDADCITLYLRARDSRNYELQLRKFSPRIDSEESLLGEIDVQKVVQQLNSGKSIICHGKQGHRFFKIIPSPSELVSFASIPLKSQRELIGFLNIYSFTKGVRFTEGQRKFLYLIADKTSSVIENAKLYKELRETFRQTISGFAKALETKDRHTYGHSDRVSYYSRLIAEGLGLPQQEIDMIYEAAILHDIGKLGIDSEKLNKVEKLTTEEYEMFKSHCLLGKQILEPIGALSSLIPIIYYHHEQFDGSGYPMGLKGKEIPLGARILAIADSFDAMTSDRPYRKALSDEMAKQELKRCSGNQFDPELVDVFLRQLESHGTAKK